MEDGYSFVGEEKRVQGRAKKNASPVPSTLWWGVLFFLPQPTAA